MNIRKFFTRIIDQKTNDQSGGSGQQPSRQLSNVAGVIKSIMIDFLPDKEKIQMAKVDKSFYQFIQSKATNTPSFYYAVGSNIVKKHVSEYEIVQSLNIDGILFRDYHAAQKYAYLRTRNEYNRDLDAFLPLSIPAVFIVQLNKDGPYSKISTIRRIEQHIPECPMPPAPERMLASGFKVSPHNITIHFSNFNGRLFRHNTNESDFSALWSSGFASHHDLQRSAAAGVIAVFNSYFTCYSRWTRHNQALVSQIIDKAQQNPSIDELHNFIISAYQAGVSDAAINKNGTYMQMLRFVKIQLNILRKIDQLPGINGYLRSSPS